ncbi:MAG TPA: HAMP domain-containing sensor histidine kinase [Kofleriaceae bacterium]|nr:HAMP domain-containing sensor histidine kinase [Kofleriaceae bacterium]
MPPELAIATIKLIDAVIGCQRRFGRADAALVDAGATLGVVRFRHGFRICELASDIAVLSDVVLGLAAERGIQPSPGALQIFNDCLECANREAVSRYFEASRRQTDRDTAQWIGALGHELRNVTATATMAFEVLKALESCQEPQAVRVLERSLHRLDDLVAQTLAAAQLSSGRDLHPIEIPLAALVEEIEADTLHERGVTLTVQVEPGLVVAADFRLLEMALGNLVQNAFKFTRDRGRVELRAKRDDDQVVIEVEDECGGLEVERPEELFRPFVQGRAHTRGIGLGLAITHQAIEAHGGTLTVRDLPGKGCVFAIALPSSPRAHATIQPTRDELDGAHVH